jgi:sarcosine oxidase, subunit alpha
MRVDGWGALIDRSRPFTVRFDEREYPAFAGDTLASVLLAAGVHHVGTSVKLGRPRGILSAGSEEPGALVQVLAPVPEPMRTATTVDAVPGLVAVGLPGQGWLPPEPDSTRYDHRNAHGELLVVGGGPAGLLAALDAARDGARVILVDERPSLGGSLYDSGALDAGWLATVETELRERATVLTATTALGRYDDNFVPAVQRLHRPGGTWERLWRIRAARIALATGAHERPLVFAGNDRPGVLLAGAARAYLHRYGVLAGTRAVVFTTDDSAYDAARDLHAAGMSIAVIVDARPAVAIPDWCAAAGVEVLTGHAVHAVRGDARVTGVRVGPLHAPDGSGREEAVDTVLVCGGWNPAAQLYAHAGGRLVARGGTFVPDGSLATVEFVSPVPGNAFDLPYVPAGALHEHFVDFQRDVTVADIQRATGAGLRSVEHVKRYTTAGTAHDQGKTSGVLTSAVVAAALETDLDGLGYTTLRPPYLPVSFAALAGRYRGELFEPVRTTPIHERHLAAGAPMENVGQWHRPWYYPQPGETMAQAVHRECVAARTGLAMMDVSTLGKIDVQGPDAGEFLDRLYTNMMSTLPVGSIRYGVMCHADGMVFDDGTVARLDEQRFLVTTTTGNAAAVLDWMEEWSQTEWPQLRVWCTSVTEHWATVALVGPGSREALRGLAPELAVDNADFPFMTWRDATVAGLDARVCRISFSGELAYEISVPGWHGIALWDALAATGATPYGTETMHVLRAEKGYPIVGQDTDGTVTPQDLGLGWAVSKKKRDFVGKRSHSRADTTRPDRKQLVGLLPEDGATALVEGVHLVEPEQQPPLGHVTSAYHSAALGSPFALALISAGRARVGTTLHAVAEGDPIPVRVVAPVLVDPEGARRDG